MKSTLLILIGYITCTLKCEMNKTEAEEKTDNVEPLNEKGQQGDVQQPKDAVPPEGKETTDAGEPPDDNNRPVNVEQPENAKQLEGVETTNAVDTTDGVDTNTTYAVEQLEAAETTDAVHTTDAGDTTYAVEQPVDIKRPEDTEKTEATKKQKIQADDTSPSKIRVEDALKILEKCKNKYALESIALIKMLKWLRSTFNITELMIDHKIDPNKDFDDLSDTQNSLNTSNILRNRVEDGFLDIKQAILDASNFKAPDLKKKERKKAKTIAKVKKFKTIFIATHSDREYLEKNFLADSDRK